MAKFKFVIAACARWETDHIAEWLNYHRSIGCDHVYLYCNDDDPAELYGAVLPYLAGNDPFVTFLHFPFIGRQRYMYLHFLRHYRSESEWVSFIDIDEFIQIMDGEQVPRFIDRFSADWDAIALNWLIFGTNGYKQRPRGSVLLGYPRRAGAPHPHTKVLSRVSAIPAEWLAKDPLSEFWHHWHGLPEIRTCNVLGESLADYYTDFPNAASRSLNENARGSRLIEVARIAHFTFRSENDFLRRAERSTEGEFSGQTHWRKLHESGGVAAFVEHLNAVEDRSLVNYWSAYLAKSWQYSVVPRPPFKNIALHRPSSQSSLSTWSTGPDDAAGAVSGTFTGGFQCHTSVELAPWWEVELEHQSVIRQICLYNTMDPAHAGPMPLHIECWLPGVGYYSAHQDLYAPAFGGIDGEPFVWIASAEVQACKVRISTLGVRAIRLDQVEIYGHAIAKL